MKRPKKLTIGGTISRLAGMKPKKTVQLGRVLCICKTYAVWLYCMYEQLLRGYKTLFRFGSQIIMTLKFQTRLPLSSFAAVCRTALSWSDGLIRPRNQSATFFGTGPAMSFVIVLFIHVGNIISFDTLLTGQTTLSAKRCSMVMAIVLGSDMGGESKPHLPVIQTNIFASVLEYCEWELLLLDSMTAKKPCGFHDWKYGLIYDLSTKSVSAEICMSLVSEGWLLGII